MENLILKPENDPRNIEYYNKAFPSLTPEDREKMRVNWINRNIKKL